MTKPHRFIALALLVVTSAIAQADVSRTDRNFATLTARADHFALRSATMATRHTTNAVVRQLAERLIQDHGQSNAELKMIASELNLNLPTAPDAAHVKLLFNLYRLNGADFDAEFVRVQALDHARSVAMFSAYVDQGDNATLKAFAQKTLPMIQGHLRMARDLAGCATTTNAQTRTDQATGSTGTTGTDSTGTGSTDTGTDATEATDGTPGGTITTSENVCGR